MLLGCVQFLSNFQYVYLFGKRWKKEYLDSSSLLTLKNAFNPTLVKTNENESRAGGYRSKWPAMKEYAKDLHYPTLFLFVAVLYSVILS